MGFRSTFKHADVNTKQAKASHAPQEELSPAETKQRITRDNFQFWGLVRQSHYLVAVYTAPDRF